MRLAIVGHGVQVGEGEGDGVHVGSGVQVGGGVHVGVDVGGASGKSAGAETITAAAGCTKSTRGTGVLVAGNR